MEPTIVLTACGGLAGLKQIIEIAPFTVEGTITAAESKLTPKDDEVYTAYDIDVIPRLPSASNSGAFYSRADGSVVTLCGGCSSDPARCDKAARAAPAALSRPGSPRRWRRHGNDRPRRADAYGGPAHHLCVFRSIHGMVVAVRVLRGPRRTCGQHRQSCADKGLQLGGRVRRRAGPSATNYRSFNSIGTMPVHGSRA